MTYWARWARYKHKKTRVCMVMLFFQAESHAFQKGTTLTWESRLYRFCQCFRRNASATHSKLATHCKHAVDGQSVIHRLPVQKSNVVVNRKAELSTALPN